MGTADYIALMGLYIATGIMEAKTLHQVEKPIQGCYGAAHCHFWKALEGGNLKILSDAIFSRTSSIPQLSMDTKTFNKVQKPD